MNHLARRLAVLVLPALLALSTLSGPADASDGPDLTRPCESVSDVNCTYTAVQITRPDWGGFLRSVNDGPFESFTPENQLIRTLTNCRTSIDRLFEENQDQMFELQDLRPRALVAESDLRFAKADLDRAKRQIEHRDAIIKRLRERLHSS